MPRARAARLKGVKIGLAGKPLDTFIEGESIETDANEEYVISREQEAVAIDEAIVSLARAVFSESGTLVFEDHPLLTPLLEEIAVEYWQVSDLETQREPRELSNPRIMVIGHARSVDESRFARIPALVSFTLDVFLANQLQDFQRWEDRRSPRKYIIPSTGGTARNGKGKQICEF
jgi:hypothetical protein